MTLDQPQFRINHVRIKLDPPVGDSRKYQTRFLRLTHRWVVLYLNTINLKLKYFQNFILSATFPSKNMECTTHKDTVLPQANIWAGFWMLVGTGAASEQSKPSKILRPHPHWKQHATRHTKKWSQVPFCCLLRHPFLGVCSVDSTVAFNGFFASWFASRLASRPVWMGP